MPPWMFERLLHFWPDLMHVINCFPIHEEIMQFWRHQICKHYQDVTGRPLFMTVFGIHWKNFIFLPTRMKTCRSNIFLFCARQKVRALVSEVLCASSASGAQFVQVCSRHNRDRSYLSHQAISHFIERLSVTY